MSNIFVLILCVILWGIGTFLNRLSVEHMPAVLMQVICGMVYIFYIPIILKVQSINPLQYKWSFTSIVLTTLATGCSIAANILLFSYLKGSSQTGSSTMVIALYPTVTLFLSLVFLHEQLSPIKVLGITIMIAGAILLNLK